MSNRNSYTEAYQRLPVGLRVVFYDSERGIHQYRDADGALWESDAGNTYGVLHRVDDTPAYFHSARHTGSPLASSSSGASTPMTEFPDTWDPPANHELEELPSAKRIAAKLGNYRRQMFGGLARKDSASSLHSDKVGRSATMPVVKSSDSFRSTTSRSSGLSVPAAPIKGRTF